MGPNGVVIPTSDQFSPVHCIEAAAAEVLSANTRRAYATAWRTWSAWCASEDVEPLPAEPVPVAAYLAERPEAGAGISTLRTATADEHASRGAPSPATHPDVRRVLRGLARRQASAGLMFSMEGRRVVDAQGIFHHYEPR